MTEAQYRKEFINHLMDKYAFSRSSAEVELDGWLSVLDDGDYSDPIADAEECLSYYGE